MKPEFEKQKIQAFDAKSEAWIIGFSFVGIAVCLMAWLFGYEPKQDGEKAFLLFISASLFLNVTHNAFTLHALCFFPEIRNWIFDRPKKSVVLLLSKWTAVFLILLFIFRFTFEGAVNFGQFAPLAALFGIGLAFLPFHHGVKQIFGISMIYNQKLKLEIGKTHIARFETVEKRERVLFWLFLISRGACMFAAVIPLLYSVSKAVYAFAVTDLFVAGAIIWNSTRYPQASRSNKSWFLGRLLFYALVPVTFFATSLSARLTEPNTSPSTAKYRRARGRAALC